MPPTPVKRGPEAVQIPSPLYAARGDRAILTLVISYEAVPERRDISELLDKARELGGIEFAQMRVTSPQVVDVDNDWEPVGID